MPHLHFYNLNGQPFYDRPIRRAPQTIEQASDILATSLEIPIIVALSMQTTAKATVGIFEWGPLWGFWAVSPTATAPVPDKDFSMTELVAHTNLVQHDRITH